MIREIENVFIDFPGYGCFACDPRNNLGLKMKFFADDEKEEVFVRIKPEEHFSGFPGILHGGVQCALVDEVAFWAMFDRLKKIGVTVKVEMDFLNVVKTTGPLEIRGKIDGIQGRRVVVSVSILNDQNEVCTRSRVVYFIPRRQALLKIMGEERFTEKFLKYLED
ncbi:MAG: PaaI family thioesterase [Thermodesulfobacteriota bacterium]